MTLVADLLDGDHRALARAITNIENRAPGYRDLVSELHHHAGDADVLGVTGAPGAGKSTLVDKLAAAYRERGETVGVIAIDPSSPFTGGAVLGDRIRMASNAGDMDVFFRSMSTRGSLGGLSTATTDAVTALDAFGKDRIIVETVGAGQNEIDIVKTADTVAVLVPPDSGDDVQMLKAGILEIADVFVVNKADLQGADRTVQQLREMLRMREGHTATAGHHGASAMGRDAGVGAESGDHPPDSGDEDDGDDDDGGAVDGEAAEDRKAAEAWSPPIIETVANQSDGIEDLLDAVDDHLAYLDGTGARERKVRSRYAAEIRALLRQDANDLLAAELDARGGLDQYVQQVLDRESDPYSVVDEIVGPLRECVQRQRED